MKARLVAAIAGLAIVLASSGSAGTARVTAAPAYGLVGSTTGGALTLVRVDPVTLIPLDGGLAISNDFGFGGRSPDGRSAVFFNYRRPSLRVVDLEGLKSRGDIVLAPAGWRARAAAWLTADRVAVVIQRMRGSYSQIVDRREVVIVDPFARRVLLRRHVAVATALTRSASGGDKLVLLLGRGNARTRMVRVAVADSTGAVRTVDVDLGPVQGLRLPSLTVEPSGRRAFVAAAGAPVFEIDLDTLEATPHPIAGADVVFANATTSSRQAVLLGGGILAVTGHNSRRDRGVEIAHPAGLAFVDTSTWRARLVDRNVSGASVSGDTLVGYSFRIERVQRGGRAPQKVVGIGLRAYAADGTRRWRRFGTQPLTAHAFRHSALVYRHVSPPVGSGGAFVVDLADGRQIRANSGAQQNLWLLPDVPGARAVRAPAAVRETEALQVDGEGDGFRASVRDDVTRVVATLVDGSERELAIEGGRVAYAPATPDLSAHAVQAFAGDRLLASIAIPVACGGSSGPCAPQAPAPPDMSLPYAFLGELSSGGSTLTRVEPRTLAPIGRALRLAEGFVPPYARSPDGDSLALAVHGKPIVRIVDLGTLTIERSLRLPGERLEARTLAWLRDDRLTVVAQRMSQPNRRYVRERLAVTMNPGTGALVAQRPLDNTLAVAGSEAAAGRLVLMLRSSSLKGAAVQVVVIEADGVRTREVVVGKRGQVLNPTALAVEPSGKRAYLVGWAIRRRTPPVFAVDLDTLAVSRHSVRVEAEGSLPPATASILVAKSPADGYVVATGPVSAARTSNGTPVPAGGIFVIDTRSWTARHLDARATHFQVKDRRVLTYGPSSHPDDVRGGLRGSGVSAYELPARQLYHLYGKRLFSRIALAGDYGHILLGDERTKRLVFEAKDGQARGMLAAIRRPIEIVTEPTPAVTRRPGAAAPAAATQSLTAAAPARGYTVSNRGREVVPKQPRGRLFPDHPYRLFLLGTVDGTAFYRVQVTPRYTCWGNGKASRIGELGSLGCPNVVGAYPLQSDNKVSSGNPAGGEMEYLRIDGIAVDQAATVALVDEQQRRVATVPVRANLYSFQPPYPRGFLRVVALDQDGKELKPRPEWGERQTPPPNLFGPRATRVERPRLTAPVQQGAARGVEVKAGGNGVVVFDGKAIEPRVRKLLSGGRIGVNCFVLSANHRQTRSAGVTITWQPAIAFKLVGIKAPLDGCEMQGNYGHRWRDQYGTHSAVEIPFNDRARRYFANRAAARDLALFVRSRKTQQIRKKTGGELAAALRAAYGDQVRVLGSERAVAPPGVVAVWTSGDRTVFSERSSAGVRFFVELTDGKITRESVRGLAFVF